jgi:hypothetical protein
MVNHHKEGDLGDSESFEHEEQLLLAMIRKKCASMGGEEIPCGDGTPEAEEKELGCEQMIVQTEKCESEDSFEK